MKHKYTCLCIIVVALFMYSCAIPNYCPKSIYGGFEYDKIQGFSTEAYQASIWMVHCQGGSCCCLPRNLSIQNLKKPEKWQVYIDDPNWVKGRPLMGVSIVWGALQPMDEVVSFDIYQGKVKKQTVEIILTSNPEVTIMVDGVKLEAVAR